MRIYQSASLAANTRRNYQSRQRIFKRFCCSINVHPRTPLTEPQLCMCIVQFAHSHSVNSVDGYVSAIQHYYSTHSLGPLPRGFNYQSTRLGLKNYFGCLQWKRPRLPITLSHLVTIRSHLDFTIFTDARDWCAYLFAFFGLLRVREFTNSSLLFKHVSCQEWGIQLTIMSSKTSLHPAVVNLIKRDDLLCPVAAYTHYVSLVPRALSSIGACPFFLSSDATTQPLMYNAFNDQLKSRVKEWLGLDPTLYATHSFRRGGATLMYLLGVPEATIQVHGRWKTFTSRDYFDWSATDQLMATRLLLEVTQPLFQLNSV